MSIKSGVACIASLSALVAAPQAYASYPNGTPLPAARLIQNLNKYLKVHPTDADIRYSLGRVYYAAFSSDTDKIPSYSYDVPIDDPKRIKDLSVNIPREPGSYIETKPGAKITSIKQKIQYIGLALDNLTVAVKEKPKDAQSHLTLGCAYEDGLALLSKPDVSKIAISSKSKFGIQTVSSPAELTKLASIWRARAAREYLRAFDLANTSKPEGGIGPSLVEEAGNYYIHIGDIDSAAVNRITVLRVKASVARSERIPRAVSPVIFSPHSGATLSRATQPTNTVAFDLDGTGRPQQYSWLRPDTGILVWDPEHTGRITSGRQLFGSVTWWIFWQDGYQALAALDDNADGRLSGLELREIGVWFDRNSDGISEPGEVVPAIGYGIAAISCRSTGTESGMLASRTGIRMASGATFQSWDWVVKSQVKSSRGTAGGTVVRRRGN